MDITLGFIAILLLILFPGLIFRRLFYYGEFSKQFNSGQSLISLIAISSIPGLIILLGLFLFYDNYFTEIDLGKIIDKFKDINNPNFRYTESSETPIKVIINENVMPFLGFLYLSSAILGALLGRFIRISKLDTKFKLLRFNNYWFYLFNGQMSDFKKMRHLRERNKKHVFTKADILIETNTENQLYSGIVVDYELMKNDSSTLSKVILQNAEMYKFVDDKRVPSIIPGKLLVIDCTAMKNINLTYIFEKPVSILKSKIPNTILLINGIINILLVPIFIFKSDNINVDIYNSYFGWNWYSEFFAYLFTVQLIGLLNPFSKKKQEYFFVTKKDVLYKLVLLIIFGVIVYILH